MTVEKYVFYCIHTDHKTEEEKENYQIYIFSKQYNSLHTQRKSSFLP